MLIAFPACLLTQPGERAKKQFQIPGNSKVINILLFLKEKVPQAFLYSFYLFEFLNLALSFCAL